MAAVPLKNLHVCFGVTQTLRSLEHLPARSQSYGLAIHWYFEIKTIFHVKLYPFFIFENSKHKKCFTVGNIRVHFWYVVWQLNAY